MDKVLFSSKTDQWSTPQDFFDELNEEFHFNLDPCADESNHKCEKYFTQQQDGLKQDWGGRRVFCNPPYGKAIKDWVRKCYYEAHKDNTLVVLLIPARTDTTYFQDYILHRAEIRFIRGRLKFGESKDAADRRGGGAIIRRSGRRREEMKLYRVKPFGAIVIYEPVKVPECVYVCAANKADAKRAAKGCFPVSCCLIVEKVTKEQIVRIDYEEMEEKES